MVGILLLYKWKFSCPSNKFLTLLQINIIIVIDIYVVSYQYLTFQQSRLVNYKTGDSWFKYEAFLEACLIVKYSERILELPCLRILSRLSVFFLQLDGANGKKLKRSTLHLFFFRFSSIKKLFLLRKMFSWKIVWPLSLVSPFAALWFQEVWNN